MKKAFTQLLSLCVVGLFSMVNAQADEPTLNDQLRATAEAAKAQMPAGATASMEKAIQSLRDSGITEHALKKGDTMPDFTLPGIDGKPVSSKALRKKVCWWWCSIAAPGALSATCSCTTCKSTCPNSRRQARRWWPSRRRRRTAA